MCYKIEMKCTSDKKISDKFYKNRSEMIDSYSIHDALCDAIDIMANEVLKIKNKPTVVMFEVTGYCEDGRHLKYQGKVTYKENKWIIKNSDKFSFFNETIVLPYSIEINSFFI